MFAIVLGEFMAGIFIYNTKDEIAITVKTKMENSMGKYNKTHGEIETKSWDVLQLDVSILFLKFAINFIP